MWGDDGSTKRRGMRRRAPGIIGRWGLLDRDAWLAWYAERGLATVPVVPRGKRPLRAGWQRGGASAWAGAPPDANLGVVCGAPSGGLVVLDFDTPEGVRSAFGMRPERVADHTLVVRTSRGWHVYARESGRATSSPWPGLDVRGERSLVVAPPSVHPSGIKYEFVRSDVPISPLCKLPVTLGPIVPHEDQPSPIDWEALEALVGSQASKLRRHWALLREPRGEFDRSRADFAVARCLWEAGYELEDIARVLLALPGSKASERGQQYAFRTAARAAGVRNG